MINGNIVGASRTEEYIEVASSEELNTLGQILSTMRSHSIKSVCIKMDDDVWFWDVAKESDNYATVKAYRRSSYGTPDLKYRNYCDGTWSDWAWVNPPMIEGVEYLTVERYKGMPVYTQLVDCGDATIGKSIDISNIGATRIVRHEGTLDGATTLPYIHSTVDNAWSIWLVIRTAEIIVWCGESRVGGAVKAQLWYTKD